MRRRRKRNECKFPGCQTEIKSGATRCSMHWGLIYAVSKLKGNKDKSISELIPVAVEKHKAIKQRIQSRKEEREEEYYNGKPKTIPEKMY